MYSDELQSSLRELNLKADLAQPDQVRAEILDRLSPLHPDKTGGRFADTKQEKSFQHLLRLLEIFDKQVAASRQLVPLDQFSNLLELFSKAPTVPVIKTATEQAQAAAEPYRRYAKRKYALPKITSALLASLCFTLIALAGNFKGNPLYRVAINHLTSESQGAYASAFSKRIHELLEGYDSLTYETDYFPDLSLGPIRRYGKSELPSEHSRVLAVSLPVDLFGSTEPAALKRLEVNLSALNTKIATLITQDSRVLSDELMAAASRGLIAEDSGEKDKFKSDRLERLAERMKLHASDESVSRARSINSQDGKLYYGSLQGEASALSADVKDLQNWSQESKSSIIERGNTMIVQYLTLVTVAACFIFALAWSRERSDERWLEYLSSNEGIEFVFSRLCADSKLSARNPSQFTLTEFSQAVSVKDLPAVLSLFLGQTLDVKHLGQVTDLLIAKLKSKKVINEIDSAGIQSRYQITVTDQQRPISD